MRKKHLVVIGGGAAGFFCAVNAARLNPALEVTIVEKSSKLLSKVKVSGGGRCNVTHACYSIAEMVKKYPRGAGFLKKAFHHFFTTDTIEWFTARRVALKTETDGRMFPVSDSSQTIVDCLLKEANRYHVNIMMNAEVQAIEKQENIFSVMLSGNRKLHADTICVASGGYPKITQFGWIAGTGHEIENPVPSLFTFNMPGHSIQDLMGIAVENAAIKIMGTKLVESGPVLITHWGLSGPAVLRLSAWAARELQQQQYHFKISINWAPVYNENSVREKLQQLRFERAGQKITTRNAFELPSRLWEYLLQQSGIDANLRWADVPAKEQNKLARMICAFECDVKGKTTFKEEFVTAGGIQLNAIDHNTMQSKKVPGLFFAGEVIDVDGITGGFNFQNAWTTGFIAAKAIAAI
ncbi:MAG: NAD(P)/FAD-dependent oxidoreductase [Bacteroidetes bacterium]|nr:NAD(P)/FAD-dependent oxidoreductase [Bacteroidota bacterium]